MPAKYTPLAVDDNNQIPVSSWRISLPARRSILCFLLFLVLVTLGYQSLNLHFQSPGNLDQTPGGDEKEMSGKLNVA